MGCGQVDVEILWKELFASTRARRVRRLGHQCEAGRGIGRKQSSLQGAEGAAGRILRSSDWARRPPAVIDCAHHAHGGGRRRRRAQSIAQELSPALPIPRSVRRPRRHPHTSHRGSGCSRQSLRNHRRYQYVSRLRAGLADRRLVRNTFSHHAGPPASMPWCPATSCRGGNTGT